MTYIFEKKIAKKFYCKSCDYECYKNSDWKKHVSTQKHTGSLNERENRPTSFICICGKEYKHRQSLYKHKLSCVPEKPKNALVNVNQNDNTSDFFEILKQNDELKALIMEQNKIILDLSSKITNVSINNSSMC